MPGPRPRKTGARPAGRAPASYNKVQLHSEIGVGPALQGRGGARNHKGRVSFQISSQATYHLVAATQFAIREGLPFNRFITVSWFRAGVQDAKATDCLTRFLKVAGGWIRSRNGKFAWVFVREHDPAAAIGSHVHILVHISPDLATDFGRRVRGWVALATGCSYVKGAIKSRPVGRTSRTYLTSPQAYHANLCNALAYMLKAADPSARLALNLPGRYRPCPVTGKRTGTSQNIGIAAQRSASLSTFAASLAHACM